MTHSALHYGLMVVLAVLMTAIPGIRAAEIPRCDEKDAEPIDFAALLPDLDVRLQDGQIVQLTGLAPLYNLPQAQQDFAKALSSELKDKALFAKISNTSDRWGRQSASVFFENDAHQIASLNAMILMRGFARFRPDAAAAGCRAPLLKAESDARNGHKGLWADGTLSLYPADMPEIWQKTEAPALDGSFIIVEGQVRRTVLGQTRVFLDFADKNTRNGFSVTILKKNLKIFEHQGLSPDKLLGHTLRVRGVLDMRYGMRMELTTPDAMERVD